MSKLEKKEDTTLEKQEREVIVPTDEEMAAVTETFVTDRMKFVSSLPFYGILLLELDPIATGIEIPVAAVNYKNLFLHALAKERCPKGKTKDGDEIAMGYNYCDLSAMGRKTVLAHEICHVIFEHLSIPTAFNKDISNLAMDAVIQRILDADNSFSLGDMPEGVVTPIKDYGGKMSGFTVGPGKLKKTYNVPDYDKKDWVPIYWDIYNQMEQEAKKSGASSREGIAEAIKKMAKDIADSNPMNGDTGNGKDEENSAEFEQAKAKFRQKVVSAVETCKSQGTVPAEFIRMIEDLEEGKVHWTTHLRRLLKTEITKDDFSHKVNSRRSHIMFGGRKRPPIFPKVESEALGHVFLALDTSGSMSQKDIREGLSEFASLRQATPFNLHFMSCDAKAYEVTSYDRHEEPDWLNMPISGGGGTDFNPVFGIIAKYKEEQGVRPALLVYFTDGYGTFPEEEPEFPVIWVVNCKNGNFPWGTVINTSE